MIIKNIFKRKKSNDKEDLDKAKELGLITEEEMLRLKIERAEQDLKEYLDRQKKK